MIILKKNDLESNYQGYNFALKGRGTMLKNSNISGSYSLCPSRPGVCVGGGGRRWEVPMGRCGICATARKGSGDYPVVILQ